MILAISCPYSRAEHIPGPIFCGFYHHRSTAHPRLWIFHHEILQIVMIQGWKENDGIQGIVAGLRPGPEEKNRIIVKVIVEK